MTNKYFSKFNRRPTEPAPTGDRFAKTYQMEIDKNGHKFLKETGLTDIYELIQSHLEESKIENIITRAAAGDLSGLMAHEGKFLDFRDAPGSLAAAQNLIIKIEQEFDKLPLEIRAKFDHSPEKYIASYGSTEWKDTMGLATKATDTTKPETSDIAPAPEQVQSKTE